MNAIVSPAMNTAKIGWGVRAVAGVLLALCLTMAFAALPDKAWGDEPDQRINDCISGLIYDTTVNDLVAYAGMEIDFDDVSYGKLDSYLADAYGARVLEVRFVYREKDHSDIASGWYEAGFTPYWYVPEMPEGGIFWIEVKDGLHDASFYSDPITVKPSESPGENIGWRLGEAILRVFPIDKNSNASIRDSADFTSGPWFKIRDYMEVIEIGEGVTEIGSYAFYNTPDLAMVLLPESLQEIDDNAFRESSRLSYVSIPKNVARVGDYAFNGCPDLAEVVFEGANPKVGYKAFNDCSSDLVITGYAVDNPGDTSLPNYCHENEIIFNAVNGDLGTLVVDIAGSKTVSFPARPGYDMKRNAFEATIQSSASIVSGESIMGYDCNGDGIGDFDYTSYSCVCERMSTCSVPYNITVKLTDAERLKTIIYNAAGFYYSAIKFRFATMPMNNASISIPAQTYTGKALKPAATVKLDGQMLQAGTDYTITYSNNKNAGTAKATLNGTGDYSGSITKTFTINKVKATAKAKKAKVTVKYSKVKKKAKTVANLTVKCDKGKASYKNASKNKTAKKFKVNAKNGKVTVPKGTKKGTYAVKVKVKVKAGTNYKKLTKTVSFKVKVG